MKLFLKEIREKRGLTMEQAAELVGTSAPQISRLEKSQRDLTWEWATRLAAAYDVDPVELMFGKPAASVPVVGIIGDGAAVQMFDSGDRGVVSCPRGLNPKNTVALHVRGDALLPTIGNGWYVFYSRLHENSPADVIGQLCIVVVGDRTMVRSLRRGPSAGHFNLESPNGRTIEDVTVLWCSRVRAILPPDLVDPGQEGDALKAAG